MVERVGTMKVLCVCVAPFEIIDEHFAIGQCFVHVCNWSMVLCYWSTVLCYWSTAILFGRAYALVKNRYCEIAHVLTKNERVQSSASECTSDDYKQRNLQHMCEHNILTHTEQQE